MLSLPSIYFVAVLLLALVAAEESVITTWLPTVITVDTESLAESSPSTTVWWTPESTVSSTSTSWSESSSASSWVAESTSASSWSAESSSSSSWSDAAASISVQSSSAETWVPTTTAPESATITAEDNGKPPTIVWVWSEVSSGKWDMVESTFTQAFTKLYNGTPSPSMGEIGMGTHTAKIKAPLQTGSAMSLAGGSAWMLTVAATCVGWLML